MAPSPGDLQRSAVLALSCSTLSSDQSLWRSPLAFNRCSAYPGTQYSRVVGHFGGQPSCWLPNRRQDTSRSSVLSVMCLAALALNRSSARSAELGHSCAWLLCRLAALALGYVLVAMSFGVALCVFACLSVYIVVDFLLLSFPDTCSLSDNSGTRLLWPPSHSLVFVCLCVP
jgi:hypothetical protein